MGITVMGIIYIGIKYIDMGIMDMGIICIGIIYLYMGIMDMRINYNRTNAVKVMFCGVSSI